MKIINNEARVHHVGGAITLLPGENEVDAAAWAKVSGLPVVQSYVRRGALIVLGEPQGEKGRR